MGKSYVRNMVRAALFAGLTAVCAWISVPVLDVAFTMQTFALLLTLGLLGGKWGTVSILIYLALGACGLPVFAGFQGGPGVLAGPTGGYLWGFALAGLVYWSAVKLCKPLAMVLALVACYLCGCLWFSVWTGGAGFWAAVLKCVVPYLIPDGIKLYLAWHLTGRLDKFIAW